MVRHLSVLSTEPWGLKRPSAARRGYGHRLSVLSTEPWGLKPDSGRPVLRRFSLSVLSTEPWGLKLRDPFEMMCKFLPFSALDRAVGFET